MGRSPIRVLLADDHSVVRNGIKSMLAQDPDISIIGEACDGEEAVRKAVELEPDIVLMDVLMPKRNGIDAAYAIVKQKPAVKVLMLSVIENMKDINQALRFGASGYILKGSGIDDIADAIKTAAGGNIVLSPEIGSRLMQSRQRNDNTTSLSDREYEVFKLLGKGLSNHEIALRLFITESTVRTYVQRINEKLKLKSRANAVSFAIEHGISQ